MYTGKLHKYQHSFLHCTLSSAAQCTVIGPVCLLVGLCVCLWVCYHDISKLGSSIFTWVCRWRYSDLLQLIKFWPSRVPWKGVCGGAKFLAPPYSQRAVFASPPTAFSFPSVFVKFFLLFFCFVDYEGQTICETFLLLLKLLLHNNLVRLVLKH